MVVYSTIADVIGQLQQDKKKKLDYYICRSGIMWAYSPAVGKKWFVFVLVDKEGGKYYTTLK